MKAFKIKKRNHRQSVFIIGPSITSFAKPKLPHLFFKSVHKPALFIPQSIFEIVDVSVIKPQVEFQPLSETVATLVEFSGL